ncbi:MAG: hypothetical protein H3C43_07415 [Leptonema sp. (in: Bacteria)]|nr:hypothetical protein [Leptonema sp. (in: bacteria)]
MQITYDLIKPIIANVEVAGSQINVAFKTEDMATPIRAVGTIMPDMVAYQQPNMKSQIKTAGTQMAMGTAYSLINQFLGQGVIGQILRNILGIFSSRLAMANAQANMAGMQNSTVTEESKAQAIVQAFHSVAQNFEFDQAQNKWKAKA